ncbi:hypothetical protein IAT38_004309 [Cryptococcus sp. DSM 104549]
MPIQTISILYPGAMGSSLAHILSTRLPHLTLLTSLTNRSPASIARARAVGLTSVPMEELVQRSDVILSVLPPSAALGVAQEVAGLILGAGARGPIFIDANAISPTTAFRLSSTFPPSTPFIDGSIIGFPAPLDLSSEPKLYLSAEPKWEGVMQEVVDALGGGGKGKGLDVRGMKGAGVGGASALKMCYGGINKGATGLAALMILSAQAHSAGTAKALLDEMAESQPFITKRLTWTLPDMVPKAYRWVGEMEEISLFIAESLESKSPNTPSTAPTTSTSPANPGHSVADTFQGLAAVFQRLAEDARQAEGAGGPEKKVIDEWAEEGKRALAEREGK